MEIGEIKEQAKIKEALENYKNNEIPEESDKK
jgi:hypothetical protein